MPAVNTNTEVKSIVSASLKVPVRKFSRIHMITSKRSIIKRVRFIRFDICDKKQNNIQYHCCTICPFTTLYLPAGNDCIYCIKSVIECPLLHSLEVFCCFAPGTGLFPATKSHLCEY